MLAALTSTGLSGYSVRITAKDTTASGVALAEIYDTDAVAAPVRIANVSTLGFVGTGVNVLTAGFVIRGAGLPLDWKPPQMHGISYEMHRRP